MAGADPAACLGVPRPAVLARASGSSTVRMLARSAWQAHSAVRVTIAASSTLTVSVLPVFLVGALAGPIGADLGFGSAGTGLAITAFFAAGAVTAVPMGRLTERLGATVTMRAGVALSGSTTLAIGLLVDAWWHLAALLALAGCSVGLADTGGARSFADAIRTGRHGLAFAAKEASVPAASMLAGFSIPLLAERFGWTWAFVVGACLAPVVVLLIPPAARTGRHEEPVDAAAGRPKALMWLAIGVAVAAAASNAAATLFVPAMTDVGWSAGSAGALLALASIVTMGTRLVLGWASDQLPAATWWHLAGAISLGAVGAGLLAGASAGPLIPVGTILVLGAGWGWSGLAFLSAVRAAPRTPAVAAGVVLTSLAAGGASGPAAFGLIAERASYTASWVTCAAAFVVAAILTGFSGHARPSGGTGP